MVRTLKLEPRIAKLKTDNVDPSRLKARRETDEATWTKLITEQATVDPNGMKPKSDRPLFDLIKDLSDRELAIWVKSSTDTEPLVRWNALIDMEDPTEIKSRVLSLFPSLEKLRMLPQEPNLTNSSTLKD
jgi:hypothetical protein